MSNEAELMEKITHKLNSLGHWPYDSGFTLDNIESCLQDIEADVRYICECVGAIKAIAIPSTNHNYNSKESGV